MLRARRAAEGTGELRQPHQTWTESAGDLAGREVPRADAELSVDAALQRMQHETAAAMNWKQNSVCVI